MKKSGHGGKRKGAGRKPGKYPTQLIKIKCTDKELVEIYKLSTRDRAVAMLHASVFQSAIEEKPTIEIMNDYQKSQSMPMIGKFTRAEYPDIVTRSPEKTLKKEKE